MKTVPADQAVVMAHAFLADYLSILSYALTAKNFNPVIAMTAWMIPGEIKWCQEWAQP